MADLSIGLNGLNVALAAIETIGNNIANGATEGYHRQSIQITPVPYGGSGSANVGGGSQVTGVRRQISGVVENELLRQQPALSQVATELDSLLTVESTVGNMSTGGLSASIDAFFNSLKELAGQPGSTVLRDQVCGAADAMTAQFHDAAAAFVSLQQGLEAAGRTEVDQLNSLAAEVGDLNRQLAELQNQGTTNNNLADRRDEDVKKMTELLNLQIQSNSDGTVSLMAGGTAIVLGSHVTTLALGRDAAGQLGVAVAGAPGFNLAVSGGQIGGVLSLSNDLLPGIAECLDTLAGQVIQQVNQVHVQGIGTDGSFTDLEGTTVVEDLASWQPPLSQGAVSVRVIDTTSGQVARYEIAVDPAADSLSDVIDRFNSITGLTAQVSQGRIELQAASGYTFDFVPAVMSQPEVSHLTGTAAPTLSGAYTGSTNQTLTFRVVGSGRVGVTDGLKVEVVDGGGSVVRRLSVGLGYAAGDALEVGNGVKVAFAAGTLNDAETFSTKVLASSDTSGFLAGAGLNTFFSGVSAATINLAADVRGSVGRLATSREVGGLDNGNAALLAEAGDTAVAALGGLAPGDYYRRLVAQVGQEVSLREGRREGIQNTVTQLQNQRESLSGVDLNQEAAQLMIFEQMFQTMAKYLTSVDKMQQSLFAVI
jgi:flagellar hook-associated protein 1